MTIFTANNVGEIATLVVGAAPGDEVHVIPATAATGVEYAPGLYMYDAGPTLNGIRKTGYVTVKGADPDIQTAWRGRLGIFDCAFIRVEGVRCSHHLSNNNDPVVIGSASDHVQIVDCDIRDGDSGFEAFSCTNIEVIGNRFGGHLADAIKCGALNGFLIENNDDDGTRSDLDPAAHKDFIQFTASYDNGIIRGNTMLGHNVPSIIQGIFLDDASGSNTLVENNIIFTNAANGILLHGASGCTIRKNTILGWGGTTIIQFRLPTGGNTLENNVANAGAGTGGVQVAREDYGTVYQSVPWQNPATAVIEDFRPVVGGPADFGSGIGAEERIFELLQGTPPPMADTITITSIDAIRSTPNAPAASAVIEADNTITINPNDPDYTGLIEVDYTVTDAETPPQTASATIFATFSGTAPVAADDVVSGPKGAPINLDPKLNDTAD